MFAFGAGTPHSLALAVDQQVKRQVASNYYDSQKSRDYTGAWINLQTAAPTNFIY